MQTCTRKHSKVPGEYGLYGHTKPTVFKSETVNAENVIDLIKFIFQSWLNAKNDRFFSLILWIVYIPGKKDTTCICELGIPYTLQLIYFTSADRFFLKKQNQMLIDNNMTLIETRLFTKWRSRSHRRIVYIFWNIIYFQDRMLIKYSD